MIDYKGYTGVFEFDPDLRLFAGHVVDLQDEIYFEGDSVEALEASMRRAVDHYLEVCAARSDEPGRPFSGKLNVRLGSDVHRAAAVAAAVEGESLNAWLTRVVADAAKSARKPAGPPSKPRRRRSADSKAGKAKT
jgi:predicted HicB family RNase H-like nuclease